MAKVVFKIRYHGCSFEPIKGEPPMIKIVSPWGVRNAVVGSSPPSVIARLTASAMESESLLKR
jgi:hypothetical protein